MADNSLSDNASIRDYQTQLLSMAQPSSEFDSVQPPTPPLTPPPFPAQDFPLSHIGLIELPTQILKLPARLAIECYHRPKFSKATLPNGYLYEYCRSIAEDELSEQELYILCIFTLNVNASVLFTSLLRQTVELSWSECEELSDSFLPDKIQTNCAMLCARYSRFVGVEMEERAFKDRIWKLLAALDYSLIEFLVAERARKPGLELPVNLQHCAQPALENFYAVQHLDVCKEFIRSILDNSTPLVLGLLSLFTLDVTPSACRDEIELSPHQRSLLGSSIQEQTTDRISGLILKQGPLEREKLESVVMVLPINLWFIFRHWSQPDIQPAIGVQYHALLNEIHNMTELLTPPDLQQFEKPSPLPRNVTPLVLRLFTIPKVLLEEHMEEVRLPRTLVTKGADRMLVAKCMIEHMTEKRDGGIYQKCLEWRRGVKGETDYFFFHGSDIKEAEGYRWWPLTQLRLDGFPTGEEGTRLFSTCYSVATGDSLDSLIDMPV